MPAGIFLSIGFEAEAVALFGDGVLAFVGMLAAGISLSTASFFVGMPAGSCLSIGIDLAGAVLFGEGVLFATASPPPPNKYPKELCPPPQLTPRPIFWICSARNPKPTCYFKNDKIMNIHI